MKKIAPERLSKTADYIFGGAISGSYFAQLLGLGRSHFWIYIRQRGITTKMAATLAAALDREASKLRATARDLRDAIKEA